MSREMYPTGLYVDDATRQLREGEMPEPPEERASPMMLRARETETKGYTMPKSLYLREKGNVHEDGYDFCMKKFNVDQDFEGQYGLIKSNINEWTCSCPARTTECRHVKMMQMFDRAESGEDPVYAELSAGGQYVVFLQTDNKFFGWVRGPEVPE